MHKLRLGVIAAAALMPLALASPAHADTLTDQVNGLMVAAEDRTGYNRDLFGDYNRDALLAANFAAFPECDGYYSAADDQCYSDPGEVDVDHMVALAEAWDSGASKWTAEQLDDFPSDTANLWLMTDNLNQSDKSDDDAAEWLPPYEPAVCGYVQSYVAVKVKWKLAVDTAEKSALLDLAADCAEPEPEPSESASEGPTTEPTDEPTTPATTNPPSGDLPITGAPLAGLAIGGVVLLGAGTGLMLARRRRTRFTA